RRSMLPASQSQLSTRFLGSVSQRYPAQKSSKFTLFGPPRIRAQEVERLCICPIGGRNGGAIKHKIYYAQNLLSVGWPDGAFDWSAERRLLGLITKGRKGVETHLKSGLPAPTRCNTRIFLTHRLTVGNRCPLHRYCQVSCRFGIVEKVFCTS